jgi:hypothetical protein
MSRRFNYLLISGFQKLHFEQFSRNTFSMLPGSEIYEYGRIVTAKNPLDTIFYFLFLENQKYFYLLILIL